MSKKVTKKSGKNSVAQTTKVNIVKIYRKW